MPASHASGDRVPVALVGIGCRFPGGIADPAGFWRFLVEGRDAIAEIPRDRFDLEHYYAAAPATPGRTMTRWGGYLERLQEFDPTFFGMSPREAERLDPQQRLILETGWEALEDAGQNTAALEGSLTGVFIGQWLSDFEARLFADPEAVDFYMTTGSGRYATSGRLSYLLGLRGPSLTIDTACSSSLVAVHMAVRSLRSGETTLAIAGGVNTILQPHISVAYSQSRMMAPDGRCKFGDAAGDGYVRSEGAGLVVLKRLDAAVRDGDRIYAVIRGSATNNDGRSSGSMGTPSRLGQEELLRAAYKDAAVSPGEVNYIEAHGTGTRAGDPVELGALSSVLSEGRGPGRRAYVGSVKTNFGHTEGAAGIAGLIKAALVMHHGAIPASLHCKQLNPNIPWAQIPLEIARTQQELSGEGRRFAGVSAFGIAGANAHVVLESAGADLRRPEPGEAPHEAGSRPVLLPLSARSPEGLRAVAGRFSAWLVASPGISLDDAVWNAAARRTALEHRVAFVAPSRAALIEALDSYAVGGPATAQGVWYSQAPPKVAFVVPGQGAQWTGMARQLAAREPVFREALERCDHAARAYCDYSIVEQLHLDPGSPGYRLDRIDVIQPVLIAMAIAYAQWLASVGVEAEALVGHSMGEVGAAYLAGALDLDQAMRVICRRSALMSATSGQGAMAMIELSMADAAARLVGRESRVSVAVSNSPRSSVISGDPTAVQEVVAECERDGIFCRFVKVDVASHSPQMEVPAATLQAELARAFTPRAAKIPLYSTVFARKTAGTELDAAYWAGNMRQPVRFAAAVREMLEAQTLVFVELGPHPVLMPAVQQTADSVGAKSVTTIACGRRDEDEHATALVMLASLWTAGLRLDWRRLLPRGGRHVSLPPYPWQRERHWIDAAEPVSPGRGSVRAPRLDEESLGWLYRLEWISSELPTPSAHAMPAGARWLVVSQDAAAGMALAAEVAGAGVETTLLVAGAAQKPAAVAIGAAVAAGDFERVVVFVAESDGAAYLPIEVLQAVSGACGKSRSWPRLWFLTSSAHVVGSDSAVPVGHRVSVMQAALWGTCRVISEEHPEFWGGLVDLDPGPSTTASAAALASVLLATDGEDQIAVRDGKRFCLRLERFTAKSPSIPPKWRSDAAYLITGGLGDIGLRIARALVEQGVRRLVLLGRTPLPPREQWAAADPDTPAGTRIAAIRALESAGAAVLTVAVDVADEGQVASFLARYHDEAWPPIRGVVHAAGSFANQLAGALDRRSFEAVLAPKLRGAQILDRLLPDLDFLALFSSTGSFVAQPGQANYAAANAGLDAIALDRRARGRPSLSIAWSVWRDTGLVKGATAERNVAEMTRQGIRPFEPEKGTALFTWLCGRSEPALVVLSVDWVAFRGARGGRDAPLYRDVIGAAGNSASTPGADFAERLAAASVKERRQLLETVVRETVGKVLSLAPARIDPRRVLGSMGLGSLGAMELRNRLESVLRRPLSATLAWNYPTVEALSAYLAGDGGTEQPGAPAVPVSAPAADLVSNLGDSLSEVAALSDEEALLALRGSRVKGRR